MGESDIRRNSLGTLDLTERQLEVLRLKSKRWTNAEIAENLVISITTVKWHIRQIYNKLGANNRTEAVGVARQLGILDRKKDTHKGSLLNFPTPLTPFIGRAQEIEELKALLTDTNIRLVNLIGLGGIGKTRLSIEAAKGLTDQFVDGICWVTFSGLDEAELVFTTVDEYIAENMINALGLILQGTESPIHFLQSYLANRNILMILDSFEAIIAGAAFISNLLSETQNCKILITSRERLNLPGEVLFPIQGLTHTRMENEESIPLDAVALFTHAASRVSKVNFTAKDHFSTIQRLCHRLEGMPLAIELAAEWTRLLPVDEIEQELDHGLTFLDSGSTSIHSVFDRSWNQLSDHQRKSFARLAVFQRGFTREAAKEVAGADLETLSNLFDKSLIQKDNKGRYTLHDLLRQYAAEKLEANGSRESTRDAHCAYFAALTDEQIRQIMSGNHRKIMADIANIRAAWRWAVKYHRLDDLHKMWFTLGWFFNVRASYHELAEMRKMVFDEFATPNPEGLQGYLYGRALYSYGLQQSRIQGIDRTRPIILEGIEIVRKLGTGKDLAWPMILTVAHSIYRNDPLTRQQYCLESIKIFEELDDPYGLSFSLLTISHHYLTVGQNIKALHAIERGLAISRSINDTEGMANALRNLGYYHLHLGNYKIACQNFEKEATLWTDLALPRLRSEAVCAQGQTLLFIGDLNASHILLMESLIEFEELQDYGNVLRTLLILGKLSLKRKQPHEAKEILQDAQSIMEKRQDSKEQAQWCLLTGRISLLEEDYDAVHLSLCCALESSTKIGGTAFIETILDFAKFYYYLSNIEAATCLLGFAKAQPALPAIFVRDFIDPLKTALAEVMDEIKFTSLLEEGASLTQQDIIDSLLADCG